MHIVHVYKDYHPVLGGIEGMIQATAECQVKLGYRVTVLVTNPGYRQFEQNINGVHVIRAGRIGTIASTPLSISLPLILRKLKPDLAHLHFPYPLGEISQWLLGRGWPYVISYHSDVVQQVRLLRLYGPILKKVLDGAAQILPTSSNYMYSSPWLRPRVNICTPIPLGIDPSIFTVEEKLDLKKRWPEVGESKRPWVLFLGRHRYYKGVDDLIKALQYTDADLLIGGDGKLRASWEQLVEELGLVSRVHFLGNIDQMDLPGLYQAVDCFVLPSNSRAEAFGIVLLEAMAAGLPCITTELSTATSYLVQDGITGLVVAPQRPDELGKAINTLLGDSQISSHMGALGRDRVINEFNIERMVEDIDRVYQNILGA